MCVRVCVSVYAQSEIGEHLIFANVQYFTCGLDIYAWLTTWPATINETAHITRQRNFSIFSHNSASLHTHSKTIVYHNDDRSLRMISEN